MTLVHYIQQIEWLNLSLSPYKLEGVLLSLGP